MMNGLYYLNATEIEPLLENIKKDKKCYLAELDGTRIKTEEDYLDAIWALLRFPRDHKGLWARYYDWIRDLSWLIDNGYDKFAIIIRDYKQLRDSNRYMYERIVEGFANVVLPFWFDEVQYTVVGGKPMSFNVYIIN